MLTAELTPPAAEARPSKAVASQPQVRVQDLVKRFRGKRGEVVALDHVSLEVGGAEKVVLLGPSGCGKTTLLRCVAGLETPDEGEIEIGGQIVFSAERGIFVPPEARGINMMFQSYALWPHMTAFGNVAFPLESRGERKAEIRERVQGALRMVDCDALHARYPSQLSGGQQQRIALARAIVGGDQLILFDEPLSNVDAKVREQLRGELLTLQRRLGFAALYVTHDQTEATAMADRIAVFQAGRIVQADTPQTVYNHPGSSYVADFVGASNVLSGRVARRDAADVLVEADIGPVLALAPSGLAVGEPAELRFRPEHVSITPLGVDSGTNCYRARLEAVMFLGNCTEYLARIGEHRIVARSLSPVPVSLDEEVLLTLQPGLVRAFAAPADGR